jgi:hypothetical protein
MGLVITQSGSFAKTERFLKKMMHGGLYKAVEAYASEGTAALQAATPVDSGITAASWSHEVEISGNGAKISWVNSHVHNGVNIAIILQFGHGTGTGGYVQGRDYINPAMRPVFDKIAEGVWKEVTSSLWRASTIVLSIWSSGGRAS